MRYRSALALALLLPSLVSAQGRRPRIGGGGRPEPAPLGPQPQAIAKAQAIVRSKLSFETYPMINHVNAPGFSGGRPVTSWNNFGTGTHVDYRHTDWFSTTMDVTASYMGGPATTQTIEGGFRIIRPQNWEARVRPFADVRFGWQNSADQYMSASSNSYGIGPAVEPVANSRYSRGFGGIVGVGSEIRLTNSYSVITGLSAMRANMNTYNYRISSVQTTGDSYHMTTYRLALGLRYNQTRTVNLRQPAASQSLH